MQTEFVCGFLVLDGGQTIDYMRDEEDLPEVFSTIFVIDPTFKLVEQSALHKICAPSGWFVSRR